MLTRTRGSFSTLFVAACLSASAYQGASANIICDGSGCMSDLSSSRSIHRLTVNKVNDANVMIDGDLIYWERFGNEHGDTEIFSFDIGTGTRARLTRNSLDDKLQAPGVWVSTPYSNRSLIREPFGGQISNPQAMIAEIRRNYQNTNIYKGGQRISPNKRRHESSVRVAENTFAGMVWLSTQAASRNSLALTGGTDVFWYNGRNHRTKRLTHTSDINSVAFDGPWAAWTTIGGELTVHHVRQGITRTLDVEDPFSVDVSGTYVKYEAKQVVPDSPLESRLYVHDIINDTTIEVGESDALGYHRDSRSVLDDHYLGYQRFFNNPSIVTNVYPPMPEFSELRIFDLEEMTDILVTEGSAIGSVFINDDMIVWQMLDTSSPDRDDWDYEIFSYDIRRDSLRQVTDNDVDDLAPKISGDTIVWTTRLADGTTDIYAETYDHYVGGTLVDGYLDEVERQPPVSVLNPGDLIVTTALLPEPASLALFSLMGGAILRRSVRH